MRKLILCFTIFSIVLSCKQNQDKKNDSAIKDKKLVADSTDLKKEISVDSISEAMGNYTVISARSYFFASPDLSKKRKDYLERDKLVLVSKITNGFAYARPSDFSDSLTNGWLLLGDLKQVFFTAPKVSGSE